MRLDHLLSKEQKFILFKSDNEEIRYHAHCLVLSVLKYLSTFCMSWGCSSVGRASALQAGGQEFDSPHLHHYNTSYLSRSIIFLCTLKSI